MILVDTNLLVYAWDQRSPQNGFAGPWLDRKLSGSAKVALPWQSLLGFLRIVTNPRIYTRPASVQQAWGQVCAWMDCPCVWLPEPGVAHREILGGLLGNLGGGSKLIPDAHLAALAIEHGLTLCSSDGDFARFAGLQWINPLTQTH